MLMVTRFPIDSLWLSTFTVFSTQFIWNLIFRMASSRAEGGDNVKSHGIMLEIIALKISMVLYDEQSYQQPHQVSKVSNFSLLEENM